MKNFNSLTVADLFKPSLSKKVPGVRGNMIIHKILNKTPFVLKNGKQVVLANDSIVVNAIQNALKSKDSVNTKFLRQLKLQGVDHKFYQITDFEKNSEFGGRGAGSGTIQEDKALTSIRNQIQDTLVKEGVPAIPIKIGNRIGLVSDVKTTPGHPKSDFELIAADGSTSFWISHKAGTTAAAFQQYSGITTESLGNLSTQSPEIKAFVNDVKKLVGDEMTEATGYCRSINDTKISLLALFGKDYKPGKATGVNNIDCLLQGDLKLVKSGNNYVIRCVHQTIRGNIPTDDYKPYFYARRGDRDQFQIRRARFGIYPFGVVTKKKALII